VCCVGQICALLVTTLNTESDFIDGALFLVAERWKTFEDVTTPFKFYSAALMRVIAGLVGSVATTMLIVYSTDVVEMCQYFSAILFVATLDNAVFELAAKGFLGDTLEKKCATIQEYRFQPHLERSAGPWTCICVFVLYVIVVWGGFLAILAIQNRRTI
jgi:hypothetical protein